MKTILFPTKFSKASRKAILDFLRALFDKTDEKLNLVLLNTYNRPTTGQSVMLHITDILEENAINDLEYEKKIITKEFGEDRIDVTYYARQGKPYRIIDRLSKRIDFDLLVLGISGSNILKEMIVGNTAADIVANTQIPTLLIPEHIEFTLPKKVAIAADLTGMDNCKSISKMMDIVNLFGSELVVVNVCNPDSCDIDFKEQFRKKFNREFEYYCIENKDIIKGITKYVDENSVDMLAIVDSKEDTVYKLYSENVSKKLTTMAKYPFIVIHDCFDQA